MTASSTMRSGFSNISGRTWRRGSLPEPNRYIPRGEPTRSGHDFAIAFGLACTHGDSHSTRGSGLRAMRLLVPHPDLGDAQGALRAGPPSGVRVGPLAHLLGEEGLGAAVGQL